MATQTPLQGKRGSLTAGQQVSFAPLTTERPIVTIAFLVILAAALVLTTTPRMITQVTEEGLQASLLELDPVDRNMQTRWESRVAAGDGDPFAAVSFMSHLFRTENMTPTVQGAFPTSSFLIDTPALVLRGGEHQPSPRADWFVANGNLPPQDLGAVQYGIYLHLRQSEGIEEKTTLVEGRLPERRDMARGWVGADCPAGLPEAEPNSAVIFDDDGRLICIPYVLPLFEVVLTAEHLELLDKTVGDRLFVFNPVELLVEVVGVIEVDDPVEDYWFGDQLVERPALNLIWTLRGLEIEDAWLSAVYAPDAYPDLLDLITDEFTYRFTYFLDPTTMTPDLAAVVESDVRFMESSRFEEPFESATMVTGLPLAIDTYFQQMARVLGSLATTMFGVAASALALVGLLAYLIEHRQRSSLVLVRNRGGSPSQLTMSQTVQALVITVPAITLAYLGAMLLVAYESDLARNLALIMVVAVPIMFVVAAYPTTHAELGSLQRSSDPVGPSNPRRRVFEFMVVLLSVIGVVLVLRRGSTGAGVDVMLAAVPTMLAIAGGLIATRLITVPVGLAAWVGTRMAGIANFVGFRRVRQQASRSRVPMLVIVVTVALAVFAFVVRTSVMVGDLHSSYATVGADLRITSNFTGGRLPSGLDLSETPGVDATALGLFATGSQACFADRSVCDLVDVLVVDGPGYHEVLVGTAGDPSLPTFLASPPLSEGLGTREEPLPALVSSNWQTSGPPTPGRVFSLRPAGALTWYVITEVADTFPGLDPRRPFVVVDLGGTEATGAQVTFNATTLFVRAGADAAGPIEETARSQGNAFIENRHTIYEGLRTSLLARTVSLGLLAAMAVLIVFAALATAGFVILTDRARLRDLGFLRTIGLSSGQARGIASIEVVSTTLVAALAGSALALLAVNLLRDVIGLDLIAGGGWVTLVAATIFVPGFALLVLFPLSRVGPNRDLTRILKMGDE